MKRRKIGRAVFYRSMLLLVALSQPFAVKAADCEPELLADVHLQVSPDGQLFLPATIGDRQVYFVLSMGWGLPMLHESSAKALGLTLKPMTGNGIFPSDMTHYAQLEGLKVGNFQYAKRAAPIIPQRGADTQRMLDDRPVVGEIGSTLFQHVDVELNLAERQLKLFKPFRCLARSPVSWSKGYAKLPLSFDEAGSLVFTLELNGKKVEASMLSGARDSTIDVNAAREFFGFDEDSKDVQVVDAEGGNPRKVFHAMSLAGPGLEIQETQVRLRSGGCKLTGSKSASHAIGYTRCINTVPFILGFDLLARMRIYVSSERDAVFVTFNPPSRD